MVLYFQLVCLCVDEATTLRQRRIKWINARERDDTTLLRALVARGCFLELSQMDSLFHISVIRVKFN